MPAGEIVRGERTACRGAQNCRSNQEIGGAKGHLTSLAQASTPGRGVLSPAGKLWPVTNYCKDENTIKL